MGDATLDGRVNATDLNQLGIHWQLASRAGWQDGDFNGDGNVNAADLNILGLNWQRVAAVTEPEAGSHLRVPRAPLPAGAMSPIRAMNVEFGGVATTVPQPIGQDAGLSPHETFFSVQHQQIHLPSKRHSTRIARYGHGQNHLMHVEHTIAEQDVIDKLFSWQFGEAFCDCFPKTSGPSSNQ
jgi:hypothetical protein